MTALPDRHHSYPHLTEEETEAQRGSVTPHGHTASAGSLPTLPGCVLIVFDEPSQPKVSHFAHEALSNQDVGSTEVSVDIVHPLHVRHA